MQNIWMLCGQNTQFLYVKAGGTKSLSFKRLNWFQKFVYFLLLFFASNHSSSLEQPLAYKTSCINIYGTRFIEHSFRIPIISVRTVLVKCLKVHKYEAVKYKMCSERDCKFLLSGSRRMRSEIMLVSFRIVCIRWHHTICNKVEHRWDECYMRSLPGSWSLYECHYSNLKAFKKRFFCVWANFCFVSIAIPQFLSNSYVRLSVRVNKM
jgi:hypothetical protein